MIITEYMENGSLDSFLRVGTVEFLEGEDMGNEEISIFFISLLYPVLSSIISSLFYPFCPWQFRYSGTFYFIFFL